MQITPEVKAKFELEMAKRALQKAPLSSADKAVVLAKVDEAIAKVAKVEDVKDAVYKDA